MKQLIKIEKSKVIFLTLIFSFLQSCLSNDSTLKCVPITTVNVIVNTNLPLYSNLRNASGWIYVNGVTAGTKGIIVVHTSAGYLAFDRNAPHVCPGDKTQLRVEDDIKVVCPQDGAEWILLSGEPLKIANRSLKRYQVFDNGNGTLTIAN